MHYVKNNHEAIIDRETFERVQQEIRNRTNGCKSENQNLHTHLPARVLAVSAASIIAEKLITQVLNTSILFGFVGRLISWKKSSVHKSKSRRMF